MLRSIHKKNILYVVLLSVLFFSLNVESEDDVNHLDNIDWQVEKQGFSISPTIAGNSVYFGARKIYSVDKDTGSVNWTFDGMITTHSPIVKNNKLYAGARGEENYIVFCLNKNDGEKIWTFKAGREGGDITGIAIQEDRIFVSKNNVISAKSKPKKSYIYCLNRSTGEKIWEYKEKGGIAGIPVVEGKRLVIGIGNSWVCLGTENGEVSWEHTVETGLIGASAASDNGYAYISGEKMYCVNVKTGEIKWESENRVFQPSTPSLDKKNLYYEHAGGRVVSRNKSTGKLQWKTKIDSSLNSVISPVINGNQLILGTVSGGYLYILNKKIGDVIWKKKINIMIENAPAVGGQAIYLSANKKTFIRLSPKEMEKGNSWPMLGANPARTGRAPSNENKKKK